MNNKFFFTCQSELAIELIKIIDSYSHKQISEQRLKSLILRMTNNNKEIIFLNGELKSIIRQRLGKKRIRILMLIIDEAGVDTNV